MEQAKFSSHFTFLSVLFYMAACSLLLIFLYKLISLLVGTGNEYTGYLQMGVVIVVLMITAYRLIKSDIVINQEELVIHKGFVSIKIKIKDITEIKQLVEVYGRNKELITLLIHMNKSVQPILLTLENPRGFIKELLKHSSDIKFDEELITLVNKKIK